jgi:hypothetical protein
VEGRNPPGPPGHFQRRSENHVNESFKKGDHASGFEELRLGAIDVNYTRWWLPIAPSEAHLDQAIKVGAAHGDGRVRSPWHSCAKSAAPQAGWHILHFR